MTEISELIGDGNDLVTMASVTIEDSGRYACQDADVTLQLHNLLDPQVADSGMEELYRRVELPLVPVLARMELEGVRIDPAHFEKLRQDLESQLGKLTDQIHEIAGRRFNINSPKQVGEILFDELKLTPLKKTKSGNSTDADTLESLRNAHPLPAKLLEFRQLEKLKGTYVDPLPRMVNAKTGRLHTSFSQTIAATGRLSSSDPNLQNIPIRTEEGRRIREGFIPREPGWQLFSADYSQIELRILAHLSGDATLREAFAEERDVHRLTASRMFGIPEEEVPKEQRDRAKVINFGIVYGVSAFRLSNEFGIPQHEAKKFIEDYFAVYSGVKKFIDDTIAEAHERGYVTTLLGRRRFLTDINSRNFTSRSQAERIAVNTPVQGTSADMIKLAMIRIDRRLREEKLQARMVLQVHDELIFDAPKQEIERLREIVPAEMRDALPLDVPIKVDVAVGNNWAEC
jgi:DNA polymerase-1